MHYRRARTHDLYLSETLSVRKHSPVAVEPVSIEYPPSFCLPSQPPTLLRPVIFHLFSIVSGITTSSVLSQNT